MKWLVVIIFLVLACTAYGADIKITELPESTAISSDDLLIIQDAPATTSVTKKITWANILAAMGAGTFSSVTVSDVADNNYLKITNNATRSPTALAMELYPEGYVWKANSNGTEATLALVVTVPTTSTSTCSVGQIAGDTTYFYMCVATNVWRRVAIATW